MLLKILHEPLIHFLGIALVIYMVQSLLMQEQSRTTEMTLSMQERTSLKARWERLLDRNLSTEELDAAVSRELHEKMLFEEALRLGLHRDDTQIYHTLIARMQQLYQTAPQPSSIDEEILRRYYQEHRDNYRKDADMAFMSVFVSIEHTRPIEQAKELLVLLQEHNISSDVIQSFGDSNRSALFNRETKEQIEVAFGKGFYKELSRCKHGEWSGPFISDVGVHLVKVIGRYGGEVMAFENIKDIVLKDYIDDLKKRRYRDKYNEMQIRYRHNNE